MIIRKRWQKTTTTRRDDDKDYCGDEVMMTRKMMAETDEG